jgi:hypothetical protein
MSFQSQCVIYDPWLLDGKTTITAMNEKVARDIALSALMELRGKQRVKTTAGGAMEITKSGLKSEPHRNPAHVAIISRTNGEVRWVNLDCNEKGLDVVGGAQNRMVELLMGNWRIATAEEEKAALEKNSVELEKVKKQRDAALEGPVNRALDKMAGIMEAAATKKGKN